MSDDKDSKKTETTELNEISLPEKETLKEESSLKDQLFAVLPLRDIVVLPKIVAPLVVERQKSVRVLDDATRDNKKILLVTQKEAGLDQPTAKDLHTVGVLANILQVLRLPNGMIKVLVEGEQRVKIISFTENEEYFEATAEPLPDIFGDPKEIKALKRSVLDFFEQYAKLSKKIEPETLISLSQIDDPSQLADMLASHLSITLDERQELLGIQNVAERLHKLLEYIENEIGLQQIERRIRNRVKRQMEKTQREYYLNEQLKAIHKELGDGEDGNNELAELEEKISKTAFPKEVKEKALSELSKLKNMSAMSAEATVVRNYLDWLTAIPWKHRSKLKQDLSVAAQTLDKDHYGLEKVKERILEYLAVQKRSGKIRGPILCLVGPPGVGKTSLGKSIAKATGRNFVRMSLGGVRDEAEIRGHRRTYIGAMPGKVIQGMKKAKTSNPLFLLDEIDKIASDWRGDPASALLEVLDPEQNNTFNDHYLEVDYDLSDVMFVTTANSLNMPLPLLDRMEIIRLHGYTEEEKFRIARLHLIPKQGEEHALKPGEWEMTDEAVYDLIRYYTREAGVRNLEREIAKIARKIVTEIVMGKNKEKITVTSENLEKYSGVRRYTIGETEKDNMVGVVTGLAWSEVGGDLLMIESATLPGKGAIRHTGKLGDVMQESAQAALSYVRSHGEEFGIMRGLCEKRDIHIHVPEGATPKDGPSAGVAMAVSIVSALTGIPVKRDVAMTGEITLRGRVLPIGGLKEKLLAAQRGGVKTVFIPKENEKDLAELPETLKKSLEIIPISTAREAVLNSLVNPPEAVTWQNDGTDPLPVPVGMPVGISLNY